MVEDLGRSLLDELAVAAADRENGDTLKPLLEIVEGYALPQVVGSDY